MCPEALLTPRALSHGNISCDVETVIFIHVPSEYATTNYRWAHRALADLLPPSAGLVCVNRPVDFVVAPLRHTRKFIRGIWATNVVMDGDRLAVVTPRLFVHELLAPKIPGASSINRRLMRGQLHRVMRSLFPSATRTIQWIYASPQDWIFRAFPEAGKVYHCYDEYARSPDGTFHGGRWEREKPVLRKSDITFGTTDVLLEKRREFARKTALLPNGIPEFFFEEMPEGGERFDHIPSPRFVMVGNTYDFLMYEELHAILTRHPDWHLVMIGPKRPLSGVRLIESLPNVHLVGPRPHDELPRILPQFQVGLIPIKLNRYTLCTQPLKAYAYLAAGVPVVSTDLPALRELNAGIRLVQDTEEAFEAAIAETLNDSSTDAPEKIRAEGRRHTWTSVYHDFALPVLREEFDI